MSVATHARHRLRFVLVAALGPLVSVTGDNVYTFETTALPASGYEAKAPSTKSWDENYGQGGAVPDSRWCRPDRHQRPSTVKPTATKDR